MKKPRKQHKPKAKKVQKKPAVRQAQLPVRPVVFPALPEGKKRVLNVGGGSGKEGAVLHKTFRTAEWVEARLGGVPDIIAELRALPTVPEGSVEAVWSAHNLNAVSAQDVPRVLAEFYRVLKPGGHALLTVPDIEKVAEEIPKKGLEATLYKQDSGAVNALAALYGDRSLPYKTGFTAALLAQRLKEAGFLNIKVQRHDYALAAIGHKLAQRTEQNARPKIVQEDINDFMRKRDELDQSPQREYDFTFRK